MRNVMRAYLSMSSGLAEVPRRRAVAAAKALLVQGEATAEQIAQLTDELLTTSRGNRKALSNLIRYEVDRTLDQMGLVTAHRLRALTARVVTLEAEAGSGASGGSVRVASPLAGKQNQPAPKKAMARKRAVKSPPAKKAPAKQTPTRRAVNKAPAKKVAAPTATTSGAARGAAPARKSS